MPQEWAVKVVWVVVDRQGHFVKVFKRKHLAEDYVKGQPWLEIRREDV